MKTLLYKTVLIGTVLIGLTACGSGGSGSGGTSVSQTNNVGGAYIITEHDDESLSIKYSLINHYDINSNYIEVDGNRFPILNKLIREHINLIKSVTYLDIKDIGISSVMALPDDRSEGILFYVGNPTLNIPHQGKATYLGSSFIAGSDLDENLPLLIGKMNLTADFSTKQLNGSLKFDDIDPIHISANIGHNNFVGNAHSNYLRGDAKVEGKFYGNNAASIAGIVKSYKLNNDEGWFGGFSGVKEEHLTPKGIRIYK